MQHHLQVGLRVAQAVDGGYRSDDDRVAALQQRLRGGKAHLLDVGIDGCVLFDVGVGRRHVRFGLVVIVVGDEILHGVAREELSKLAVELRRERLVGRQHQRGTLHFGDHVGHREGLARAGNAQQRLMRQAGLQTVDEAGNGGGLIASRAIVRDHLEIGDGLHGP